MHKTVLLIITFLLLAACASEEPADTTASPDATSPAPTAGSGAAGTITMADISFSGVDSVQVGDTIELVNEDGVSHTWTAEDGSFDVSLSPGDTETFTFDEPGEYSYFCSIHSSMTGVITVEG